MYELLLAKDIRLFYIINYLPHTIVSDSFFSFLSLVGYYGAVWFAFGVLVYLKNKPRNAQIFYHMILVGVVIFFGVEIMLKYAVGRLRPEFTLPAVQVIHDTSTSPSFPSGHATMAFASAYVLSYYFRKQRILFFTTAVIISFSRIFLGKHYPSDVIAGALIGLGIGYCSVWIGRRVLKSKKKRVKI